MTAATPERELAELLPAPPSASPTTEEQSRVAARLAVLMQREYRAQRRDNIRHERGLRLAGPVVVAASLAAISVLCALAVGGEQANRREATRPVAAAPEAVVVLRHASRAALTAEFPAAGTAEFAYTRSTVISNEGELGGIPSVGAPHQREIWVSQDPDPTTDMGLIREFGQDWPLVGSGPVPVGLVRPTYAWLDTLPTDPNDLLTEIESDVGPLDTELDRDHIVFSRIGDLVHEALVPPRIAAALFEAAMRIPGVKIQPGATDALGRQGIGVSHEDRLLRSVWIFDAETFELIGTRDYAVLDGPDLLMGASAVLERGVADQAGVPPARATA